MAFLETPRFPERIAYGASGGPGFDTAVVKVSTGLESRDTSLRYPVHQWDVSQGVKDQADFATLRAHFMVARGRLHGWRYKDCSDFSATHSDGVVAGITSTTFQLFKRYTAGALTLDRKILKPVSPTVEIKVSGVVTAATIDYTTGIATIGSAPSAATVTWSGEFDIPMRFDTDRLQARIESRNPTRGLLHVWDSIPVVELLQP